MIRLPSTTYILQLILSAGTADVTVSYSDQTSTAYTGGSQETAATASTQTICAAPAASTVRDIDYLSVKYKTTGGTVTIQKLNSSGSVTTIDIAAVLLVGEQLNYTHGTGWCAIDANGNRKEATTSNFGAITVTDITDSSLTASIAVFTDANKKLVSNALTGTGSVVMSSSPTITSATLAGSTTFTGSGQRLLGSGAGTSDQYMRMTNTGADFVLGIESSAGSTIISSTGAYDTVLASYANNLILQAGFTSGTNKITLSSTSCLFGGTVQASGYLSSDGTTGLTQASTTTLGKSITLKNGLVVAFA